MATSSQTINQADMEKLISELGDQYNLQVEELSEIENNLRNSETESFELLQTLYKQYKSTDPSVHGALRELDIKYHDSMASLQKKKDEAYKKQTECFRLLQKLRAQHNTYLVAVINSLRSQLAESQRDTSSTRSNNLNVL